MTIGNLLHEIREKLKSGNIEDYRFESNCIIENVFNMNISDVYVSLDKTITDIEKDTATQMADKRISGFPLQYILGEWEFYGYPFKVGKGVLIPRADTETLVECGIDYCKTHVLKTPMVADICSGSGCIAVTLSKQIPKSTVFAIEYEFDAFSYLEKNIKLNNSDVTAIQMDAVNAESVKKFEDNTFDMIISNPPYLTKSDMQTLQLEVKSEPETALFGGDDGLYFYREITKLWKSKLKVGGMLAYEIGIGQDKDVTDILMKNKFENIENRHDLGGIIRTVSGIKTR